MAEHAQEQASRRRRRRSRAAAAGENKAGNGTRVLPALLLVPVLALIVLAGRWFVAELHYQMLETQLRAYDNGRVRLDAQSWAESERFLMRVERLGLDESRLAQQRGWLRLHQFRAAANFVEPGDFAAFSVIAGTARAQMLQAFTEGTQRQPAWPLGWAILAYHQLHFGQADETDVDFVRAFERALRSGPFTAGTQEHLTRFSNELYHAVGLDVPLRPLMLENLHNALGVDSPRVNFILDLLRGANTLGVFCPYLDQAKLHEAARAACAAPPAA